MRENVDFVAGAILSIEYHGANRIVPFRCLNVTAILASFAEHKAGWGRSKRRGSNLVAFKLRPLGSFPELPALGGPSEFVRVPSLSARMRLLRSVVSECGQTPKEALSGIFQKLRRTVSTKKSMRMSRRFARTAPRIPLGDVSPGDACGWSWRPVGDVARDVLRRTIVPKETDRTRNAP
jgi:hypothetical protein